MKVCVFMLTLLLTGCFSGSPQQVTRETVSAPDKLVIDGHNWTRKSPLAADQEQRLLRYFRQNPSVADNPLVHGQPTLYQHGESGRFYWHTTVGEQVEWFFLEFSRNRFVTSNQGRGEPFLPTEH